MRISVDFSRSKISLPSSLLFSFFLATILILTSSISMMLIPHTYFYANAAYTKALPAVAGPTIIDPNLKAEVVFKGLKIPTSMAFLAPNNILVLEKNSGNVLRILNGNLIKKPLLHVNAATQFLEWGLLGIAISKQTNPASDDSGQVHTYVFLYYTKSGANPRVSEGNHIYRYELVNDQLINSVELLNLPSNAPDPLSESNHNGGKVLIGPDNNVYTIIGDVGSHDGQAQNNKIGKKLDGTSGILRITKDGQPVVPDPLGTQDPTRVYYAYGIRNSFGMDFDPVTGNLWDTENGPTYGDEINLVKPGFNSGWNQIMGVWQVNGPLPGPVAENPGKDLINFDGKGIYRSPEFVWNQTVGPSALKFLNSDKLGKQYENTMFVGNVNTGDLYNFKLNEDRTSLLLSGPLQGKVANNQDDLKSVIFGHGFGTITDLEVGPDGFLYVLTFDGTIYRIVPGTG
ncbi:MAG: PQQ-dependent sugar dehydrogenase [Nitrososphaeraceae archaeon]